jgi:hypothetical protein
MTFALQLVEPVGGVHWAEIYPTLNPKKIRMLLKFMAWIIKVETKLD